MFSDYGTTYNPNYPSMPIGEATTPKTLFTNFRRKKMTQEQRDAIYNTFLNDINAHKKLPIDEYVYVEDFLLSVREQNPKAVDIALKCVEYVNRITNYGFGKYHL